MAAANMRTNGGNGSAHYEGKVEILGSKKSSKYTLRDPEGVRPQQQNTMSGKAYIFGRKDVVALEDDEENSEIETTMARTRRPRRGPRKHSSSQFIEEDIEKGETVQSLAIRYSCTVSGSPQS